METKLVTNGYREIANNIDKRLQEFSKVLKKKDVFYELAFCLLTPQSNAKRCAEAVEIVREKGLFEGNLSLNEITDILKTKTRFHNNKASYLFNLKPVFQVLWAEFDLAQKDSNPLEIREWLVKNVKGVGLKESSHFLRNIGFRNLAILDRHILKNLNKSGVLKNNLKSPNKKEYLLIEKDFLQFSQKVGISMDELDLYFWYCETGEIFK
jgi:N-glycosylase/DNA lyase